jgi:predicted transcriptional regulator
MSTMGLGKTSDKAPVTTYLLRSQIEQLQAISAATDAPVAALIRRAIREFLERQEPRTARGRSK